MESIVVYYSRTGNTRALAESVSSNLDSPTVESIQPIKHRPYFNWLLRSCIPGSRVKIQSIETDLSIYDAVFLGTPTWTLSSPPVTEYIESANFDGAKLGIFMTYGGFDERRYLRQLVKRLQAEGERSPRRYKFKGMQSVRPNVLNGRPTSASQLREIDETYINGVIVDGGAALATPPGTLHVRKVQLIDRI